jgi:hypothetical protein
MEEFFNSIAPLITQYGVKVIGVLVVRASGRPRSTRR